MVGRGGVYFPPRKGMREADIYNWTGIKEGADREWDTIRGRIVQSHCRIMRDGYWVGRRPFGYEIEGNRYRKTLVPAATANYVPAIYARATTGESLQKIADWLTAEGVETGTGNAVWSPDTAKQILSNPPTRARTRARASSAEARTTSRFPRSWTWRPAHCAHGHEWGPGLVTVGWMPCECRKRKRRIWGTYGVRCHAAEGCSSVWYRPAHSPGPEHASGP